MQGALEDGETTYCHAPEGYERYEKDSDGNDILSRPLICKVVKPVYGMAQAGRRWQRSLFPWLEKYGFVVSNHEPCMFQISKVMDTPDGPRRERLVLGVYVDDLAV